MSKISRRKFLTITACSIASTLPFHKLHAHAKETVSWKGIALGAEATMTLFHEDKNYAKQILKSCLLEIQRLEGIFSLYNNNSSISKLNKDGVLTNPPTNGGISINAAGELIIAANTTAGTYVYTYEICEVTNPANCDTAEATVVVAPPVIDAIDDDFRLNVFSQYLM